MTIEHLAGWNRLMAQDEQDRARLEERLARDGRRSPRGGRERTHIAVRQLQPGDLEGMSLAQLASLANHISAEMRRRRG